MNAADALIGIDWGSSRLRAFRISAEGQPLERRESDRGVNMIRNGDFAQTLAALLQGWPSDLPVVMCGMIGSRHGWQEGAYQPCPAGAADLARAVSALEARQGTWIIGGVCSHAASEAVAAGGASRLPDVMRGEETQMIGVDCAQGPTLVVAPGTHSKWAVMCNGRIEAFRTYMTGEMYALLTTHSSLTRLMDRPNDGKIDEAVFLDGLHRGLEEPALLHSLFSVRTRALFGRRPVSHLASFVSGILIGSEVGAEKQRGALTAADITVIAGERLGRLYDLALAAVGCRNVQRMEADLAVARGIWRIWELRGGVA